MVKISKNEKPDSMLPTGWISIKKYRRKGASKGKCDITYYSPDSVPFRSLIAVKRFLSNNADLAAEEKEEEGDIVEQNNVVSNVSAASRSALPATLERSGDSDGLIVVVDSESSDDSDNDSQSMWL